MNRFVVCALYKFVRLDNFEVMREPLLGVLKEWEIKGTLLLAAEGLNGTVAGTREGVDALIAYLEADARLDPIERKESYADELPFYRTKVKLKKEIVTMGVEGIDPNQSVGRYVEPEDWNRLIQDPDVILIDTRNDYEVSIGTFEGAVNPNTKTFREFPDYVQENLDPAAHKKVAMFCTGGIRCEKSTAYLKQQGFSEVFHLKGGILNYLEKVSVDESLWRGECFVFDNRVSVDHALESGLYEQCHACRHPISEEEMESHLYEPGVSCPRCFDSLPEKTKDRARERQKQMELAKQRGEAHLGDSAMPVKTLLDS